MYINAQNNIGLTPYLKRGRGRPLEMMRMVSRHVRNLWTLTGVLTKCFPLNHAISTFLRFPVKDSFTSVSHGSPGQDSVGNFLVCFTRRPRLLLILFPWFSLLSLIRASRSHAKSGLLDPSGL